MYFFYLSSNISLASRESIRIILPSHVQVLAHLLFPLLVLHRYSGGLSLSFDSSCFQRFVRLSSCRLPWPPRDKFYFRLNLRPSGIHGFISPACRVRTERERDRGGRRGRWETRAGGATRFYSGSEEARKRNKEKTREKKQRRHERRAGRRAEETCEGCRRKEKVPRNYYTLNDCHSRGDPGAIIFPKLRLSTRSFFFFYTLFLSHLLR